MKASPRQLELTAGKTREQLLQDTAPNIDFQGPAFQESLKVIDGIEKEEAARTVLGMDEMEATVRSKANAILTSVGLQPVARDFDDFDWATDDAVILHEQRATAVYHNKYGGLVIRQEKTWDEESDPYIVIGAENAVTFMEALAKRARE